ncbi:helix-turn-helix domain-containing protein [Allochromatium palmeri]|uniref:Helix-turn-helix domain-containing protein n=2 Tax=Allochromatium palmeri TaxID=231048 RepID=A0A6N8EHE8_9GAMM|nr:helix-turn-helix domain-containing protein [Allochromatium palmeri]
MNSFENARTDPRNAPNPAATEVPFLGQWRLDGGPSSADVGDGPSPLPPEVGEERLSFEPLGEGAGLFEYRGLWHRAGSVWGQVQHPEPLVQLRIPDAGRTWLRVGEDRAIIETPQRYGLFFISAGAGPCHIRNQPGEPNRLIAPMMTVRRLQAILEGLPLPRALRDLLEGRACPVVAQPGVSVNMRRILSEIRSSPYSGEMRALHLQSKFLDLIVEMVADLSDAREQTGGAGSVEQRQARMARDILMAELTDPPSVEQLARRVGLNQKRLNAVFRDLYGAGVFQCLTRWRMDEARALLTEGEVPIKQIAQRLGYAHTNNFTLAFARHVGVPPGSYRRR